MGEPIAEVGYLAGLCGHDGTEWLKVLIDNTGRLKIVVDTLALPDGAATAANQTTMITALQLIDDLRNALGSVGTDALDTNVNIYEPRPSDVASIFGYDGAVVTGTWTTVATRTVTTGKTWWITDFLASDGAAAAGVEFIYVVKVAGTNTLYGRVSAGGELAISLKTPVEATSGQTVDMQLYHFSGVNRIMIANMRGFEV